MDCWMLLLEMAVLGLVGKRISKSTIRGSCSCASLLLLSPSCVLAVVTCASCLTCFLMGQLAQSISYGAAFEKSACSNRTRRAQPTQRLEFNQMSLKDVLR